MTDSYHDSKTPSFAYLDETNYPGWAIRMEARLIQLGLLDQVVFEGVDGEEDEKKALEAWKAKRKPKTMAQARAEIILRVTDSQLVHMHSKDPMVIWDELQRVHVARGFATRLALRRRFIRLVKSVEETMAAWVGRVKAFSFKLEDVGVEVSDEDQILVLTNGLDDSYENFIITLDSMTPEQLTMQAVVDRLINEEMRRGDSVRADMKEAVKPEAYVAAGERKCWRCGEVGHIKAFCTKEPAEKKEKLENQAHITYSDVQQLREIPEHRLPGHVL